MVAILRKSSDNWEALTFPLEIKKAECKGNLFILKPKIPILQFGIHLVCQEDGEEVKQNIVNLKLHYTIMKLYLMINWDMEH